MGDSFFYCHSGFFYVKMYMENQNKKTGAQDERKRHTFKIDLCTANSIFIAYQSGADFDYQYIFYIKTY